MTSPCTRAAGRSDPGEVVLSRDSPDAARRSSSGQQITVTGVPGTPRLTVVGIAKSVTDSADGWVMPAEIAAAARRGHAAAARRCCTGSAARAPRRRSAPTWPRSARRCPAGAVTGTQSYLTVQARRPSRIAPIVPFVVAFGIIGLVMSVLIVANVVSGAVVAGYRRIGILKSIGFTPAQVVAAYAGQVMVPAAGRLPGRRGAREPAGRAAARPDRERLRGRRAARARLGGRRRAGAMCGLVGIAALLPALRAGRLSAVQAIAAGRAPRSGRGYAAHRLLGRLRLPRPVTIGLAAPFARPARTAVTLAAILLGASAVTFAVGLGSSLSRVVDGLSHSAAEPVQVALPGGSCTLAAARTGPGAPAGRAQQPQQSPRRSSGRRGGAASPAGHARATSPRPTAGQRGRADQQVPVNAFRGNAAWTGYAMISGHWYTGPGQVDVPTDFLTVTGKAVGDTVTISVGGAQVPVRIVGEVFDTENRGLAMLTDWPTLARADPRPGPAVYDVGAAAGHRRPGLRAGAGQPARARLRRERQRERPVLPDPDRPDRHADPAAGRWSPGSAC